MLSRQVADKLAKYETPFYLYDVELLNQTLESLMSIASKYGYKVHYAIKANYDARLLQIIRKYGVVSTAQAVTRYVALSRRVLTLNLSYMRA